MREIMPMFTGLSAFPLTPADAEGVVDVDALGRLLDRLVAAGIASIGLLGSTGSYAYLDPVQRGRAVAAAVECIAGRASLVVGVGALRTSWARDFAVAAERAGADGLLLAPMSYAPLTVDEVADHYAAVAAATGLPLCIYNNPGTTRFVFPIALLARLAAVPGIGAVKMPLPADGDFSGELAALRVPTPPSFGIGYSGDWGIAAALLAGANGFYSAIAGVLPGPMLRLARAAGAGRTGEVAALEVAFAPLWGLLRAHGGLRVSYAVAAALGLAVGVPPAPVRRFADDVPAAEVALSALAAIGSIGAIPDGPAIPGPAAAASAG